MTETETVSASEVSSVVKTAGTLVAIGVGLFLLGSIVSPYMAWWLIGIEVWAVSIYYLLKTVLRKMVVSHPVLLDVIRGVAIGLALLVGIVMK